MAKGYQRTLPFRTKSSVPTTSVGVLLFHFTNFITTITQPLKTNPMNRRNFLQQSTLAAAATSALPFTSTHPIQAAREYYELRVYQLPNGGKRSVMDAYWKDAVIPSLNAQGVQHVGVFTELGQPDPPRLYVLLPYASLEQWQQVWQQLDQQPAHQKNSAAYQEQDTADNPNFVRYENSLMLAFEGPTPDEGAPANRPSPGTTHLRKL